MLAWTPPQYLAVFMWIGIGGIMAAAAGPLVVGALWERATKKAALSSLLWVQLLTGLFIYRLVLTFPTHLEQPVSVY
ncbi:hypothetical protein [Alteribacillus bidgolensis]|uniref:Uncharacterized protein n=1 Tax=Alteribacillus bidgolensis TaxID=930129 RepID=A0A1G8HHD6_9BACI|nr:hypothetical protein [Alteribacillus bidgolensis]SDI06029.1 hypothetical protein SAMN05216352_104259 [Alteribacillus bidgolensis]